MSEIEVKQQILLAATRLFAHKGYGATSVREVVEAAGVTKPTLYYWFQNKEALFLEIVHGHIDALNELVRGTIASEGTVRERLLRFVRAYMDGVNQNHDAVRLLMTITLPTQGEHPQVDLMSMHLEKMQLLAGLISEGVRTGELRADLSPHAAVMALVGMVNLLSMGCVHGMPLPADAADNVVDIFFRGVGA